MARRTPLSPRIPGRPWSAWRSGADRRNNQFSLDPDHDPLSPPLLAPPAQAAFRTGGEKMEQGACRALEAPGGQDDEPRRLLGRADAAPSRGTPAVLETR